MTLLGINLLNGIGNRLIDLGLKAEEAEPFTFFTIKKLTQSEVVFYIGVFIITGIAISYLFWKTMKLNRDQFKERDIPVETIRLKVMDEDEREKEKKYEKEVEALLKKKRYRRR